MVALLVGSGLHNDPQVVERLRLETEYDPAVPPPSVPVATARRILEILAGALYPEMPYPEAIYRLGRLSFEGYSKTPAGTILLTAIQVWGPQKLAKVSPQVYRGVFRYGDRSAEELGPDCWYLFHRDEPGYIEFIAGMTEAVLEGSGAKNCRAIIEKLENPDGKNDYRLEVSWE
jgi:uncharacterized protein (TIGR02265 family)